jgi:tyrosyl-tRNA synthetase
MVVSNLEWAGRLSAIDLLRDVGKHFSVNRMLDRETVRTRLADSACPVRLRRWNPPSSLVIRRSFLAPQSRPLSPGTAAPFGSQGIPSIGREAVIWLSADLMSPYAFCQFWLNVADAEAGMLLRVFTFRSREEIASLDDAARDRPVAREAHRALAEDVTRLVHGATECRRVVAASQAMFGHGDLESLNEATLAAVLAEIRPFRLVSDAASADGRPRGSAGGPGELPSVASLTVSAGVVPTRSAARRMITEGVAYLNNRRVASADAVPAEYDLLHGRYLILQRGKRTVGAVEVVRERP